MREERKSRVRGGAVDKSLDRHDCSSSCLYPPVTSGQSGMPQPEQVPLSCAVPHPLSRSITGHIERGSGPNRLAQVGALSHERAGLGLTEDETSGRIESGQGRSDQIRSAWL